MTSKARLLKETLRIVARLESESLGSEAVVCGMRIIASPGVFSPAHFVESEFFATRIPAIVGDRKSFLEVGTGTGVIALAVAQHGTQNVYATDVSWDAVSDACKNAERLDLKVRVYQSDLFEELSGERFWVIFWNHPFHCVLNRPGTPLQVATCDYHYENLERFFRDAKEHLYPGGEVLLGTSNIARINCIKRIAKRYGYSHELLVKSPIRFAHRGNQQIDLRIYSFQPERNC